VRRYRAADYPQDEPIVPHGMSVIVNAPSVFRFTAAADPQRHLEAAALLRADTRGAGPNDAGEVLAERIVALMRATGMPNGLAALDYGRDDTAALSDGAYAQQRLLRNAPREISRDELGRLFEGALRYW
jgi:hydroxyacid-oxoacid transhydrogenase